MQDLNDFYYFVQVVEHQGFAAASRALNLPKSTLNCHILKLEARLGARLIQRTSRKFAVTDSGREVYRHAVAMLVEAERAENGIKLRLAKPKGVVRCTCSVNMAQSHLASLLPEFLEQHPDVDVFVHATNRVVDVIQEGFDVALRGHIEPLATPGLEQRVLAQTPWHLVAAPGYLEATGCPEDPAQLERHAGLMYGSPPWPTVWKLRKDGSDEVRVTVKPRLATDNMVALREAAEAGLGITAVPEYLCRTEIVGGKLRRVLPEWTAGNGMITLLVPSARGSLPAVRSFRDYLIARFPSASA